MVLELKVLIFKLFSFFCFFDLAFFFFFSAFEENVWKFVVGLVCILNFIEFNENFSIFFIFWGVGLR